MGFTQDLSLAEFFVYLVHFLTRLTIVLTVSILFRWVYNRRKLHQLFKQHSIPGPKPNFFIGNISWSDKNYLLDNFKVWFQQFDDYFGYYRGDRPVLVLKNAEAIQEVFVKRFRDFPNRLKFSIELKPFSDSVLALRDDHWKHVRKILAPAFTAHRVTSNQIRATIFQSIQRLMHVLDYNSMQTIVLQHKEGNRLVNMNKLSRCFTLEIISKIAFALDQTETLEQDDSQLVKMMEEFIEGCDNILIRLSFVFPFMMNIIKFINDNFTSGRLIDHLVKHLNTQIEQYKLTATEENLSDRSNDKSTKRSILMDYVLFQGNVGNITKDETIGNVHSLDVSLNQKKN